ncbi:MAG: type VI secretion system contractile sheath large subunit [Gammaproteobacteria bacterium]
MGTARGEAACPSSPRRRPVCWAAKVWQATPDPADWQPLPAAVASQWQALRASPIAHWIGLALPRLLLRAPYGARSDAIEAFAFEELTAERRHQDYLWGNPAFACAQWIAAAFTEQGWDLRLDGPFDLIDLPTHVYQERGEKKLLACAEIFLSERAAQAMTARGIMALQSYRDRNTVRLRALHSIAADGSGLAGPWRH